MIEVEKQIDAETKEVYYFRMFNLCAVFVSWDKQVKPKGKRKWTVTEFWDKYNRVNSNMSEEPALPEIVRSQALSEVTKLVRVYTWDEHKGL